MMDNIKPKHYRTGEIDLYELWYQTYPFEQYKAIMQAIAEQNMRLDDNNRVENLEEAIYTLERLKEKEIEHTKKNMKTPEEAFGNVATEWSRNKEDSESIYLLKGLLERGCEYLARDKDAELWAYNVQPIKLTQYWFTANGGRDERLGSDYFPEVQWSDEEPTKIVDLLETYSKSEAPNDVKPKTAGQYLDDVYRYHDDLLKRLRSDDYDYLARDESGELWTHSYYPTKQGNKWRSISYVKRIYNDNFPEIQWTDDEPTKVSELLAK